MTPVPTHTLTSTNTFESISSPVDFVKKQNENVILKTDNHKTLPAQWNRDERIFQLEKRAIFSKLWLLTSHISHFKKPGDYVTGNYVFDYFIIRDRDNNYQAFHNVCRHRAYPVLTKPAGSTLVPGCKYHGWSYNTKGDLVKAPKFDEVEGFDKSSNALFKIHTYVTPQGFIFLNYDSSPNPTPFEDHFSDFLQEWEHLKAEDYEPLYTRHALGKFNWKTMMDGYQECYHCTIAHPGFAKTLELDNYQVTPLTNSARHTAPNKSDPDSIQKFVFVFPTNGVTVTERIWYIMRTVPINATETRMEFDVFGRKGIPTEELREYMKFFEQVQKEDFDLCEGTQRGLNSGIYNKGILHPGVENGLLYYQSRVLEFCKKHMEQERATGKEINPAQPAFQRDTSCIAENICSELDSKLSW